MDKSNRVNQSDFLGALTKGKRVTPDLGGSAKTSEMIEAIVANAK